MAYGVLHSLVGVLLMLSACLALYLFGSSVIGYDEHLIRVVHHEAFAIVRTVGNGVLLILLNVLVACKMHRKNERHGWAAADFATALMVLPVVEWLVLIVLDIMLYVHNPMHSRGERALWCINTLLQDLVPIMALWLFLISKKGKRILFAGLLTFCIGWFLVHTPLWLYVIRPSTSHNTLDDEQYTGHHERFHHVRYEFHILLTMLFLARVMWCIVHRFAKYRGVRRDRLLAHEENNP